MKVTETQKQMDRLLDEVMLQSLKGSPLLTEDDRAVLDDEGNPIMVPPRAPILQAVRTRLRDLGINRMPVPSADGVPDPANQMATELGLAAGEDPGEKFKTFRVAHGRAVDMPPMDDEDDDAATRTG